MLLIFPESSRGLLVLIPVLYFIFFYISICIFTKRLHDIGKSGYNQFLMFVPFYNFYLVLLILFKKGDIGQNMYGEDPLKRISF